MLFYHAARRQSLAPIAAVEYLEAALPFASDYGLGMAIAQLDLTNRSACGIDLFRRAIVARRAVHRGARHGAG